MNKIIGLVLLALVFSGCATQKNWSPTGGSKSDGTIELSYEYGMFQTPDVSEQQAVELASQRCSAWGYGSAEAFGGEQRVCSQSSSAGCSSWRVTKTYQCTD